MNPRPQSVKPARPTKPGYAPDAVLTVHEVADWLGVSYKTVDRLAIKSVSLGHRTRRYLAKHVLEFLESRAA